jgi:hypothetical protein
MTAVPSPSALSLARVPAWITLGVTLLRLALELAGAPGWLASADMGGAGALLGISWLPLLFGPWFASRLRPQVADRVALLKPLAKVLTIYGLLARLPIALLTIPAVLTQWGSHLEKFPFEGGAAAKIAAAFAMQLGGWVFVWTVPVGLLAGLLFTTLRRAPTPAPAET